MTDRPRVSAARRLARLTALGVVLLACGRSPAPQPAAPRDAGEVAVQVDNHYAGTLVVYLHSGGTSQRLGEVHFQEVKSFVLQWRRLWDGFYLRAEVIGSSERALTDGLQVQPGQMVRWTLTPSLDMSNVAIY